MDRLRIIALISIFLIGLWLVGCANQPQGDRDSAAPNGQTGGETTVPEEHAVLAGVVTEVDREPGGEASKIRSILVEEPPDGGCGKGLAVPGCEKIYFRIVDETRFFRREGGRKVSASAGDLRKGQRVRADYTGYPVAESYPAQTTARTVVILMPADSEL